jgi:uncharacterized protein with ParB-like and HNH nuclease domain
MKELEVNKVMFKTLLFGNANIQFIIPSYQRPYSWSNDQAEDFWTDLNQYKTKNESHFFGSMVFIKDEKNENTLTVIDGQQRLITATLFCCALRNFVKELNFSESFVNILQTNYIKLNDTGEEIDGYRIMFEDNERKLLKFYQDNYDITKQPKKLKEERNFKYTYDFFYQKFEKLIEKHNDASSEDKISILKEVLDKLKNGILVQITDKDFTSAYNVFETINSRGVDLTTSDLIKNWLFKDLTKDYKELTKQYLEIEKELKSITLITFDQFIRYNYVSKYGLETKKKLYSEIQKRYSELEDDKKIKYSELEYKKEFVNELVQSFDILNFILNQENKKFHFKDSDKKNISFYFRGLKLMNITQYIPIIFALFKKFKINEKLKSEFISFLEFLVNFHYLYSFLSKGPGNEVENLYASTAKLISECKTLEQIVSILTELKVELKKLSNKYLNEEGIQSIFEEECNFENKSQQMIVYTLIKFYENAIEFQNKYEEDLPTIEHFYPQNPVDKTERENVHQIGNLILIYKRLNSKLSNKLPNEKIAILKEESNQVKYTISNNLIKLLNETPSKLSWTDKDINERTIEISKHIYKYLKEHLS